MAEADRDGLASHLLNVYSTYVMLESTARLGGGLYYKYSMDFRGRIYCRSIAGFTYNKLVRYCVKLSPYSKPEVNGAELEQWESLCLARIKPSLGLAVDTDFKSKVVVNAMVELGKLKRSGFHEMSYLDFARQGVEVYTGGGDFGVEDTLALTYYRDSIERALADNNTGHIFYKDATASGLQVLGIVLGCRDEEIAKSINLIDDGFWRDTYTFIINRFLEGRDVPPSCRALFNRKHLKKTIMLINYKGSYVNCLKSFVQSTRLNPKGKLYTEASGYFREFYLYLVHIFEGEEFFKHPSSHLIKIVDRDDSLLTEAKLANSLVDDERKRAWVKKIIAKLSEDPGRIVDADVLPHVYFEGTGLTGGPTNYYLSMADGFTASYNYMAKSAKRVEVNPKEADSALVDKCRAEYLDLYSEEPTFRVERASIKLATTSKELDLRSMERAFRANFTHSVDALIIRSVIVRVEGPVVTIHDCAGVRVLELRSLKEAAKLAYSGVSFSCCGLTYKTYAKVTSDFVLN